MRCQYSTLFLYKRKNTWEFIVLPFSSDGRKKIKEITQEISFHIDKFWYS